MGDILYKEETDSQDGDILSTQSDEVLDSQDGDILDVTFEAVDNSDIKRASRNHGRHTGMKEFIPRKGLRRFLYRNSYTLIAAGVAVVLIAGVCVGVRLIHNSKSEADSVTVQAETDPTEATLSAEQLAKQAKLKELVVSLESSYRNFRNVFDVYTDSDTVKTCVDDLIGSIRSIDELTTGTDNSGSSVASASGNSYIYDYNAYSSANYASDSAASKSGEYAACYQSGTYAAYTNYAAYVASSKSDLYDAYTNSGVYAASSQSLASTDVALISDSQRSAVNEIAEKSSDEYIYADFKVLNTIAEHLLSSLEDADTYQALIAALGEIPDLESYNTALDEKNAAQSAALAESMIAEDISDVTEEDEHANDEVSDGTDAAPLTMTSSMSFGVDVSHYQSDHGTIDWKAVKDSGITFAIIKCGGRSTGSDGKLYEDSAFEENIVGALANGIQVGIYFFSQARNTSEAAAEADYCLSLISKYKITYPVAFDWESSSSYRVAKVNISNQTLTNICETFADKIAAAGYTPMIYFCRNDWYNRVNTNELTSRYKVWLAYYFKAYYYTARQWQVGDDGPEVDINYDMWQYGVTNSVPGINYYVDMNIAMFSYDNYSIDLYEPSLTVDTENVTVEYGKVTDVFKYCHATNCLGVEHSLSIKLDGKEYTTSDAINKISSGSHKITVYFNDPLYGTLSHDMTIYVTGGYDDDDDDDSYVSSGSSGSTGNSGSSGSTGSSGSSGSTGSSGSSGSTGGSGSSGSTGGSGNSSTTGSTDGSSGSADNSNNGSGSAGSADNTNGNTGNADGSDGTNGSSGNAGGSDSTNSGAGNSGGSGGAGNSGGAGGAGDTGNTSDTNTGSNGAGDANSGSGDAGDSGNSGNDSTDSSAT